MKHYRVRVLEKLKYKTLTNNQGSWLRYGKELQVGSPSLTQYSEVILDKALEFTIKTWQMMHPYLLLGPWRL